MARKKLNLQWLRSLVVARSLFVPMGLQEAIDQLGFVQADPIRAPARAQDLILRHRTLDYRAGDLERKYAMLDIEEDYLYAYGFLSRTVSRLVIGNRATPLGPLEATVLEAVTGLGEVHPRALEKQLGADRVTNAWGGFSKATTQALERLHWLGHLRVARRENGIRVYEPVNSSDFNPPDAERLRGLIRAHVAIFAPCPQKSLHKEIAGYRRLGDPRQLIRQMIAEGELRLESVDGVSYLWPEDGAAPDDGPPRVRFLAPFDPVVWDRRRFEHLWGWAYRFEAYTPPAKRVRGYYAMPLLWENQVIGWVNVHLVDGRISCEFGYVSKRPRDRAFATELDDEASLLEQFLRAR